MSWFSTWLHNTLVPTVEGATKDPAVQSALVALLKGIAGTILSNPKSSTAILQNVEINAEKLVGAALAGTQAQGLVDSATLPPGTPAAPAVTIPAAPAAPS